MAVTASVVNTKDRVNNLLSEFMYTESVENAFASYMSRKQPSDDDKMTVFENDLTDIVSKCQQEDIKLVLHVLIGQASQPRCEHMSKLFQLIECCVVNGSISPKVVCDAVLCNEALCVERQQLWIRSFTLLRRIIGRVHYKGVRELMKTCLEKARAFAAELDHSSLPQWRSLAAVIEHIFDRDAALLPAYFINNEIVRSYPDMRNFPHWKLAGMLESFIQSFRPLAQTVTMIGRQNILPIVEYAVQSVSAWRLDPATLRFQVKGNLPYDRAVLQPQRCLLAHMIRQPYSRDIVCLLLGLQKQLKQRCPALEDVLVEVIVSAMERIENGHSEPFAPRTTHLWQHISAQLIYFVVFGFSDFAQVVAKLNEKLKRRSWTKSRDHLMWILLHYISGSISKNSLSGFLPVLGLLSDLYDRPCASASASVDCGSIYSSASAAGGDVLPAPDCTLAECAVQMSAVSVWTHLHKKAAADHAQLPFSLPTALTARHQLLGQLLNTQLPIAAGGCDFRLALVCNAFSTQTDQVQRHMNVLVEATQGGQQRTSVTMPGTNCTAAGPTVPLSMDLLDALTIHAKMSLIHSISIFISKTAAASTGTAGQKTSVVAGGGGPAAVAPAAPGNATALPPALVETYARLLVYSEIDTLGIKNFSGTLLSNVLKAQCMGILYTLLEMFNYRLRHVQPHYRLSLLSTVLSLANAPQTTQAQMYLCLETTALRTISGLGNAEIHTQMPRYLGESKTIISVDSEELNRVLVLNIVRALHITGYEAKSGNNSGSDQLAGLWCRDILSAVVQVTPHTWSSHTLELFPPPVADFFRQRTDSRIDKQMLRGMVDEEYRKFVSITCDADILAQFSLTTPATAANGAGAPVFVCLLWKLLVEGQRISSTVYKVLERGGPRALSSHVRTFCDYLIHMFSTAPDSGHFKKYVDAVNKLVWQHSIVPMDRLILCLILRPNESSELRMCYLLIQMLLLTPPSEMIDRIKAFVSANDPRYWQQSDWHEKHMAFHQRFPERFAPDCFLTVDPQQQQQQQQNKTQQASHHSLPVYFGNICLRFLPVFDILIQRMLESPQGDAIGLLLDQMGLLYKFHERPVSFLYNTLYYYDRSLLSCPHIKRKLVATVAFALDEVRPAGWFLTDQFRTYLKRAATTPPTGDTATCGAGGDETAATTALTRASYLRRVLGRLVGAMSERDSASSSAGGGDFSAAPLPIYEWRFSEFANAGTHALYCSCVELLASPAAAAQLVDALLSVLIDGYAALPSADVACWCHTLGLLIGWLPAPYWRRLFDRLLAALTAFGRQQDPAEEPASVCVKKERVSVDGDAEMSDSGAAGVANVPAADTDDKTSPDLDGASAAKRRRGSGVVSSSEECPFEALNLEARVTDWTAGEPLILLAVMHGFWNHASVGQTCALLAVLRSRLPRLVRCERQWIYVSQLITPFLDRLNTSSVFELTQVLYESLQTVERTAGGRLRYTDHIVDLLYHVKYMHTGDSTKGMAGRVVRELQPRLQRRLRFITHDNLEEISSREENQQQQQQQQQKAQQQQQQQQQVVVKQQQPQPQQQQQPPAQQQQQHMLQQQQQQLHMQQQQQQQQYQQQQFHMQQLHQQYQQQHQQQQQYRPQQHF